MKLIKKFLISLFVFVMTVAVFPIFNVSANENRASLCPDCGEMAVNSVASGTTSIWYDDDPVPCTHGKGSAYYDVPQWRHVYGAFRRCSNCGWESNKTVTSKEYRYVKCYKY